MSGNGLSILSDIFVPIMVIISAVLDHFVNGTSGNSLTDIGSSFAGAIATLIYHVTLFMAQLSVILPSGNTLG